VIAELGVERPRVGPSGLRWKLLAWSGVPVVTIRPTMFLESFFRKRQDLSGCCG
jgi:hypothetical protein